MLQKQKLLTIFLETPIQDLKKQILLLERTSDENTHQLLQQLHQHLHRKRQKLPLKNKKHKKIKKLNRKQLQQYLLKTMATRVNTILTPPDPIKKNPEKCDEEPQQEFKSDLNSKIASSPIPSNQELQHRHERFHKHMLCKQKMDDKSQDLICPICLQIMIQPVFTVCGHAFCFRCLDESLMFANLCPSCRGNIKGTQPLKSRFINRYIQVKFEEMIQTGREHYNERVTDFKEWLKKRFLNFKILKPGDLIDVRDTQNIWCQSSVIKVFYRNGTPFEILIHYNKWSKLYNQVIDLPSFRLAPHRFFSQRKDIPRYNLSQDNNNLRGSVVFGNRQQIQETQELLVISDDESESSSNSSQSLPHQNNNHQTNLQGMINIDGRPHSFYSQLRQQGISFFENIRNLINFSELSELPEITQVQNENVLQNLRPSENILEEIEDYFMSNEAQPESGQNDQENFEDLMLDEPLFAPNFSVEELSLNSMREEENTLTKKIEEHEQLMRRQKNQQKK